MMILMVAIVCLALLAAGMFVIYFVYPFEGMPQYASGLLLGCVHSVLKVVLLEKSISNTADMEKKPAENYAKLQFLMRYAITGVTFAIVIIFRGVFGLFGTILGVLSLQAAAHITGFCIKNPDA